MTDTLLLLVYLAPFCCVFVALWLHRAPNQPVSRVFSIARATTVVALVTALWTAAVLFWLGPQTTPLLGTREVGFAVRIDALSVIMLWLVSFVAFFVVQFTRNYLDGDPGQPRFFGDLCLTIGAVLMLVMAGNLLQLIVAWVGTSLALNRLLLFYRDRRGAILASRKKFIVARAGDLCLIGAALLLYYTFGTADLATLAAAAKATLEGGAVPSGIGLATFLIVGAAALKSAMFPFHGWLLEVMETPTPVSALLHAGLLNAGTFLVVRFGDIIVLSPPALQLLIVVGGFTALFASIAMVTQSSVKVSLAYSSAAHMGFMLMLCGFGAHSVAIVHLVAHSFYKAHAFLASGSIIEYAQATGSAQIKGTPRPQTLLLSLVTALVIFVSIGGLLGIDLLKRPGEVALGIIFVLATTQLLVKGLTDAPQRYVVLRTALAAILVTLAFFALEVSAAWLLGGTVATNFAPNTMTLVFMGGAVMAFAGVTFFYMLLPTIVKTAMGRAAYVHIKQGFYANILFDRLVRSLR